MPNTNSSRLAQRHRVALAVVEGSGAGLDAEEFISALICVIRG
jgi:hypothetical protein